MAVIDDAPGLTAEAAAAPTPAEAEPPATLHAWYVVILLTLAYLCSTIDRQILSLLVDPIKADLGISDTQLSLLQGLTFGIFYTVAGVPMGRIADRVSRRSMLAICIGLWSAATAVCGLAGSFAQLFLGRVAVGIGEAGLNPVAPSLIRDLFPRSQTGRALSIYMMGVPLGGGLAILAGATILPLVSAMKPVVAPLVGVLQPWQLTFIIVSLPGFILALLMLTFREPPRKNVMRLDAKGRAQAVPLSEVFAFIGQHWKTVVLLGLPGIAATLTTFGVGFWTPAVFGRSWGLTTHEVGGWLRLWGLMSVVLGVIGALCGGLVADALRKRRKDGYVILTLIGVAGLCLGYGLFSLMPTPQLALVMLTPAALAAAVPPTAAMAAMTELAPARMRSQLIAIWFMLISLVGMGFGPFIIAAVTDGVFHDPAKLRYAIPLVTACLAAYAVPMLLLVRRHYVRMAEAAANYG